MIYSTDNRETWRRFDELGWDRFLALVMKAELKAWQLASYCNLPRDFDPPITDFVSVPMLFRRREEESLRMTRVINGLIASLRRDSSPPSPDEIRVAIGETAGMLGDSLLTAAGIRGALRLVKELEDLSKLLTSGDVWVALPNQRRILRTSGRLEVEKKGRRHFDRWQLFTSSERWGIRGESPSVVAALRGRRQREGLALTELQKSVMWRATHFAAIQAFADFAVIAQHPGESLPKIPGIGGAVATRGVMELVAHYLYATGNPFESGEGFEYSKNLRNLDLGGEYEEVLSLFKAETFWEQDVHAKDADSHEKCSTVLKKVWNKLNVAESTQVRLGSEFLDNGVVLEPNPETAVLDEWRTSIGRCSLDSQVEVTSFGYEWLIALWAGESGRSGPENRPPITEYEANTRVFCRDLAPLLKRIEENQLPKFKRPLAAIADLLRTFCLASNLSPLVAGAIARELHLHVEELTVRSGLAKKSNYDEIKKLREDSVEYQSKKAIEDDKSLKCIEDKLQRSLTQYQRNERGAPDLNALRVRLQDVLQSFAHPGWLIRTETARFSELEDGVSEVRISSHYVSPFRFADIDPLTMVVKGYPYAEQRERNPFYAAFREHIPSAVSKAMRDMSTRDEQERVLGSAFEIPFVAVEICRIALEHFLTVGPVDTSSPLNKPFS